MFISVLRSISICFSDSWSGKNIGSNSIFVEHQRTPTKTGENRDSWGFQESPSFKVSKRVVSLDHTNHLLALNGLNLIEWIEQNGLNSYPFIGYNEVNPVRNDI